MYVCVCMYMYVCIYTCISICICTCTSICIYIHTHIMYICEYIYIYTHMTQPGSGDSQPVVTYMYVCICICICICMCTSICICICNIYQGWFETPVLLCASCRAASCAAVTYLDLSCCWEGLCQVFIATGIAEILHSILAKSQIRWRVTEKVDILIMKWISMIYYGFANPSKICAVNNVWRQKGCAVKRVVSRQNRCGVKHIVAENFTSFPISKKVH